jgi:4-oxalocrotonate tautomerase
MEREVAMPLVNVKLIEGVFSATEKQELVKRMTEAMVAVKGENIRPVTWVLCEEVKSGDWAIAGNSLTTGDVKGLLSAKSTS